MILSELVDAFKEHYKLECFKRNTGEKDFPEKFLALILSEVCSDIQKSFGVLECSLPIILVSGSDEYGLNTSVMTVKNVVMTSGGYTPPVILSIPERGDDLVMADLAIALAGTTTPVHFFNTQQNSDYTWNGTEFV